MHRILRPLVPVVTAVSLGACSSSNAPAPENLAQITLGNAPAITSAVVNATLEGGELGSFVDFSGGIGSAPIQKSASVYSKIAEVQIERTKPMLADSQIGTFQAPIAPTESPCAVDGHSVISGDVQIPETLSVNDVITIEYVACDDGLSVVNGTISMTIRAFSGDFVGGDITFEVTVTLTALAVTEDGVTSTANGSITIDMNLPLSGAITMTVTSGNLSVSDGVSTESLTSYSLSQSVDPVTGVYTLTVSGRISSSAFEGAVDFETTTTLEGSSGEAYAYLGQLVITGDANATITVVVLDGQLVRLNIDLDGDGEIDEVIDTSWGELA